MTHTVQYYEVMLYLKNNNTEKKQKKKHRKNNNTEKTNTELSFHIDYNNNNKDFY